MALRRRTVLAVAAVTALAGCGFKLRASRPLPFATMAVTPENTAGVAAELGRYLGAALRPLATPADGEGPEAILDILQENREKLVVGVNASGQVREYELRMRVSFQLRRARGDRLIEPSTIEQHRSISFSESAVLAKEAEEALLYRDMQSDIVQQLLRRLAAVKPVNPPAAPQ